MTSLIISALIALQSYPISPVAFTRVSIKPQTFWGERLKQSREVTIPLAFSKCESEGRYRNFDIAAKQLRGEDTSDVEVKGYSFDDTDVFKTIEGASYLLQTYPDAKLEAYIDSVIQVMKAAQEPDGYLYTARTMNPQHPHSWAGPTRWSKVEDLSHEFYNLGHMLEGAIAHYQATGKTTFLDIAKAYADCVITAIGEGEGQVVRVPGHQIAEMALARLYTVTGEEKYLSMAKFFLDKRGTTERRDKYSQAHQLVTEQSEAVGHAVRAAYMYSGMADVAALTGDKAYVDAIDRIWDNIVSRKLYITGGIGATSSGEAFGANYELPNMSAYCETCAAIGNVYLNHRLFLLHGDAKYYDVLERSLYNGVISGISLTGGAFFYPNPLESMGQHQRQAWFGCACCPSNVCRFIPSVPGYFYKTKGRDLYVNLFGGNVATLEVNGKRVKLEQETSYPTSGDIAITVSENRAGQFRMLVRIPGWLWHLAVPSDLYAYADYQPMTYSVSLNGQTVSGELEKGYLAIDRKWKKGDRVEVHFDMTPRIVSAHEAVKADVGRVAVERGPLVYCAEFPDNDFDLGSVLLNQKPTFAEAQQTMSVEGVSHTFCALQTDCQTLNFDDSGALTAEARRLRLIPYYAWNHRGPGRMLVWLPQQLRATSPAMPPSLASQSRVSASTETPSLTAVQDRLVPKDADDRSIPYYHWWPKKATTEWLQYDLPAQSTVSQSSVYWFDDSPWGGCRVPQSWRILAKDADGEWQPVVALDEYPTRRGARNTVHFQPVTTTAVRIEVRLPDDNSAGIMEWEIE